MSSPQSIEDRLNALEVQNRNLRLVNRIVLLAIAVIAIGGWKRGVADEVMARRFTLVNAGGKPIAELGPDIDDFAQFSIKDPNGNKRIALGYSKVGNDSAGIWIYDEKATPRIILGMRSKNEHQPLLTFHDANEKKVVSVGQYDSGHRGMAIYGPTETRQLTSFIDKDGQPIIQLRKKNGDISSAWYIRQDIGGVMSFASPFWNGNALDIDGYLGTLSHHTDPNKPGNVTTKWPPEP